MLTAMAHTWLRLAESPTVTDASSDEQYRRNADEALRRVSNARPDVQASWLRLADSWLRLLRGDRSRINGILRARWLSRNQRTPIAGIRVSFALDGHDPMGRDLTQQATPDLFSAASFGETSSPATKDISPVQERRQILPRELPNAVRHLDDEELDRLLAVALAERSEGAGVNRLPNLTPDRLPNFL